MAYVGDNLRISWGYMVEDKWRPDFGWWRSVLTVGSDGVPVSLTRAKGHGHGGVWNMHSLPTNGRYQNILK